VLYRSADALEPGGGAREIADALYADLFGLQERDGERQSLFRYFHGRSSLATWLRAVLAQRVVDGVRSQKRLEPLPEGDEVIAPRLTAPAADPDRARYLGVISTALAVALNELTDRDRLRLSLYYVQQLTLAQAGRLLNEHEATVSRQLARTRGLVRKAVEQHLRQDAGLSDAEVSRCFDSVIEDAGPLDLGVLLRGEGACKNGEVDRSI
jgi:RNA polymerase sigma factor (sigma-70 family)